MVPFDIHKQGQIENEMLRHIVEAIRLAIAWKVKSSDVSRKLSTLRFITQSFQRHLQRIITLEQYDGYMNVVVDSCPRLAKKVDALRAEHDQLRDRADRVVHDLERLHPDNEMRLGRVSANLLQLLDQLDAHTQREGDLLQECMDRDTGGEG